MFLIVLFPSFLSGVMGVSVQELPIVSLNPMEFEVPAPGESFTIDVNVTDVANLQGYEFKLEFNNTLINATAVTPGPIHPAGTLYIPGREINSTYIWTPLQNVSDGFVWAGAVLPLFQTFTGSGIMMTINFTALATGNCTLHLYDTELVDSLGEYLEHTTLDGSVTVIPEFPTAIVMPLLLIATLAAAFLGNIVWSRKRKDAIIAE